MGTGCTGRCERERRVDIDFDRAVAPTRGRLTPAAFHLAGGEPDSGLWGTDVRVYSLRCPAGIRVRLRLSLSLSGSPRLGEAFSSLAVSRMKRICAEMGEALADTCDDARERASGGPWRAEHLRHHRGPEPRRKCAPQMARKWFHRHARICIDVCISGLMMSGALGVWPGQLRERVLLCKVEFIRS